MNTKPIIFFSAFISTRKVQTKWSIFIHRHVKMTLVFVLLQEVIELLTKKIYCALLFLHQQSQSLGYKDPDQLFSAIYNACLYS